EIANISPGGRTVITLHYNEVLPFKNGAFWFSYLMTGPHTSFDIDIKSGAGVNIGSVSSVSKIHQRRISPEETLVSYVNDKASTNQNFSLSWAASGEHIASSYLTHKDSATAYGFFAMMVLPPAEQPHAIAKEFI